MGNFIVDGILCVVINPLPYSGVVIEANEVYRVNAEYKDCKWSIMFDKHDTKEEIQEVTSKILREAVIRINKRFS